METGIEGAEGCGGGLEEAFKRAVEAGAAGGETLPGLGEGLAGIMAENGGGEIGEVGLAEAELGGEDGFEAEGKFVEALDETMEKRGDARLARLTGRRVRRWRAWRS